MNIRELKEMAEDTHYWLNSVFEESARAEAIKLCERVLSLPDDDGDELVRLAEEYIAGVKTGNSGGNDLARAVLSRYGKKEPRKVSGWVSIYPTHPPRGLWMTEEEALNCYPETAGIGVPGRPEKPIAAVFVTGTEGEDAPKEKRP